MMWEIILRLLTSLSPWSSITHSGVKLNIEALLVESCADPVASNPDFKLITLGLVDLTIGSLYSLIAADADKIAEPVFREDAS